MAAVAQPSGTVTLVFTDIEGSTRLLEHLGVEAYGRALAEHRRVVREACARHDGYEVDAEGDAFFYAFASARAAVGAVREAMTGLDGGPIRIRVGIHTGQPALHTPKYLGIDVHRAARIMSAAHGGQVVLSRQTAELLDGAVALKDLGNHRFKDFDAPERIYQLGDAEHPPLTSLYRLTLPVPATPFLGREHELAEVVALLTDPDTRLLTLTGPGGTGKTRLALQAAAEARDTFPDGVTWIPLAPLRDPALVIPTLAQTLGIRERPGQPPAETIAETLLGKKTLLLLDNAEHLLPEAAAEVAALLGGCPTLTLLVTSRERLRVAAETGWPVPPLSHADGEQLFVDRAHAAGVQVPLDDTIRELCRRLDDLPLAIELAAARTRMLSPTTIRRRLDERLDLLATRDHDVDERQRTLEATISWSYDLLDSDEQRALRALSIFAGGCTPDAAERVAGASLDLIESLLDKSLLRHRYDDTGHDRYWMLETIREYAHQKLSATEAESEAVFEAFLEWLQAVVGDVGRYWIDRDQLEWFATLETERANVTAGVRECRMRGRVDEEVRLILAALDFFDARGPWGSPFELLLDAQVTDDRLRAQACYARGFFAARLGRISEATAELENAYAIAAAVGDDAVAARALAGSATLRVWFGGCTPESQQPLLEEAVALARRSGDGYSLGQALNGLGAACTSANNAARARDLYSEAALAASEVGDQRNAAAFAFNIIPTDLSLGRADEARDRARRMISVIQGVGDAYLEAWIVEQLALAHVALGEHDDARAAIARVSELVAERQFEPRFLVESLIVLAMASAPTRRRDAVVLWSAAEHARAATSLSLAPDLQPYVEGMLGPLRDLEDFDDLWEAGGELELEEALETGLRERPHD